MSESTYKTQQSRVYGNGRSFNCTNIVTAKELCSLLNTYEANVTEYSVISMKLNKIEELLQEVLDELKNRQ